MRRIVLDTETTGLEPSQGHRIIEIGCVELDNRSLTGNRYHQYLNPDREIDEAAIEVHGISNDFLADKPRFSDCVDDFISFIKGAELIIHNAPFDLGFINHELSKLSTKWSKLEDICTVVDTLLLARKLHPGQKNNLNALCKRYDINNTHRELHGALLDAEILSDVYLAMTGGQVNLSLDGTSEESIGQQKLPLRRVDKNRARLRIVAASDNEQLAHKQCLAKINKISDGQCVWLATTDASILTQES